MPAPAPVEVVARFHSDAGVRSIPGGRDAFDYACGKARAEAIDALVIAVFDERGWSMFDDVFLKRVSVQHDGETRARVLVDGVPVTAWWHDRLVETPDQLSWSFVPET